MSNKRASGILLHISSLPGQYGIGDIGSEAYKWVDFLFETGTKYWQILPLNPIGSGNSPYQALSAFAGNPLFIDLDNLADLNLLSKNDLSGTPNFPKNKVDFNKATNWKMQKLDHAFNNYVDMKDSVLLDKFTDFKEESSFWLNDYVIFMALREIYSPLSWESWPLFLKMHDQDAISTFKKNNKNLIEKYSFLQFIFFRQWKNLKIYAHARGVHLIGDIPIFTGYDCVDVWAFPHLFQLDNNRQPTAIAGVPPDFFSDSGQLWGNPLYDWAEHEKDGFSWWINRIQNSLRTVDLIRLDHFRGFAGYFKVPADAETAKAGKWVEGPGNKFFKAIYSEIGRLPFIAEDLGVITPDVVSLRERNQLPGMKILQFGFSKNADNEYLPHNYPVNCVAYTGTHDSNTSLGWFTKLPRQEKNFCSAYMGYHTNTISHEMIHTIWRSNAKLSIAPMQDFLKLNEWARMNLPATPTGNWEWRMKQNVITAKLINWIKEINIKYDRVSEIQNWSAVEYFSDDKNKPQ